MSDVIVCVPWDQRVPAIAHVQRDCRKCRTVVAVSVTTLKAAGEDAECVCVPCAKGEITPDTEVKVFPETAREIADVMRKRVRAPWN